MTAASAAEGIRREPSVFVALTRGAWQLAIAVVAAAASGLAMVGALWCVVRSVGSPSAPLTAMVCGLWVLSALGASLSSWLAHEGEARFSASLRRQTATHIAALPSRTLSRYSGNDLRRLIGDDVSALHHMVAHLPSEIATLAVVPIATIAALLSVAGPVALLALIPGLLAAAHFLFVVPRLSRRHGDRNARVMGEIVTAVDDYSHGMQTCRVFGVTSGAAASYATATRNFTDGFVSYVRKVATLSALATAFMQAVATYAIAYAIGYAADPEALAAMLLFGLAIVTPAMRLGHGIDYIRTGREAAHRVTGLFHEATVPEKPAAALGSSAVAELVDVTLRAGDRTIVEGFSHSFTRGRVTAITGPSGCGKSTLLRAIAGLDSPDRGEIRFGTNPLGATERALPLLIPQGSDVLPGTIAENVSLGRHDAQQGQGTRALKRAQLTASPDAPAGPLSGGERQRVNIARAFLSASPLILLDEPTSALDAATGTAVIDELLRLAHDEHRAIVLVTHDARIAQLADERLVLGAGLSTAIGENA
ncbi:ABC-type multidrug transport system fused ATPase/permease subunit [Leucobacter komagatae]|uniref:ABC-type multidrug transport system fused ATPase/permease subunit n=1 Tax=Leucobacter komagatae TaxID=55969 RepID=A0A542Y252_9MICO|nr:ABC transporter ATP-binding protein [Leucobacter komagatae]TQL42103.1 ABC-type multidrug transport system fused ATPase/permease subunit [Leucobacter komagatae]